MPEIKKEGRQTVILCASCNCENTDNAEACVNCGKAMLRYNSLSGMPMLGDSSRGQVLSMRYVIEEQLSEDEIGCNYKAEDVIDNTIVLLRTLPLSVSLTSEQIELLKSSVQTFALLPYPDMAGVKAFDVHGKVRYFVHEYSEQQQQISSDTIEQVKAEAAEKIDSEISARIKAESELQAYKNNAEKLQAKAEKEKQEHAELLRQAANQAEQQKETFKKNIEELEKKLAEQTDKFTAKLEEVERRLEEQAKAGEEKQTDYERSIEQLEAKVKEQQEQFDSAMSQAELKFKTLLDREKKALQQSEKDEQALEQARAQQQEHAEQLDKAQWKIRTLSAEIEKLSKPYEEKKTAPASRFRISAAVFILLVLICGIGAGYLYINYDKSDVNAFKRWIVLYASRYTDKETSINSPCQKPLMDVPSSTSEPERETLAEGKAEQVNLPLEVTEEPTKEIQEETGLEGLGPTRFAAAIEQKKNLLNAEWLYLKSAQEGDSHSMYKLGGAYLDNDIKEAIQWFEKAVDAGNADAMFELGLMYYSGTYVKKDYSKAFEYFLESANAGNEIAMYNVGSLYYEGNGVETDTAKAVAWYEKSAQNGYTKAMNQLAQMYYFGSSVKQDFKKTAEYYERSAKEGDLKGIYNLAVLYRTGIGVEKDIRKAMLWFIKAAREGDPDSMYQLGVIFESGIGIEKDLEKAAYWYQSAAKAGRKDAEKQLAKLNEKSK
ncbi:MAG: hypothetical protein PHY02_10780, partial [Phycisphaerae bacterium]|nr:hypothetical protein [Phycisphaerae bacterium]